MAHFSKMRPSVIHAFTKLHNKGFTIEDHSGTLGLRRKKRPSPKKVKAAEE